MTPAFVYPCEACWVPIRCVHGRPMPHECWPERDQRRAAPWMVER